ncbi:MAG: Fic family protein [Polyangiaceae bacterium]|nr:Fic family protein [Polyangiaceae bacterium]
MKVFEKVSKAKPEAVDARKAKGGIEKAVPLKGGSKVVEKAPLKAKKEEKKPVVRQSIPPRRPLPPAPEIPKPKSFEERSRLVEERLAKADPAFVAELRQNLELSWVYHDSVLEGTVYTSEELRTAFDPSNTNIDSSMQPACEDIRRHLQTLNFMRQCVSDKTPITVDLIREFYTLLHPEEGDAKNVRYRKDIPQHRLYVHEYCAPEKIPTKIRQLVDWINDPETQKSKPAIRIASKAHYDLLRIFPFTHDSGKVARFLLNMMLMRGNLPPTIIHATERQRYYDALKGSSSTILTIVSDGIHNRLTSIEKLLDTAEQKVRVVTL